MIHSSSSSSNNVFRDRALCRIALGSMTVAMKAQRILSRSAIRADVVKISSDESKKGCVYGIEFSCALSGNIRAILDSAGILS